MGTTIKRKAIEPLIWIVGDTVMLVGVRASLEERKFTRVVQMDCLGPLPDEAASEEKPALIIFDLDTNILGKLRKFLGESTTTRLLGFDLNSDQVLVLDYFRQTTCSMEDLFKVIHEITATDDGFRKEEHEK